jgi:hypothetical protein
VGVPEWRLTERKDYRHDDQRDRKEGEKAFRHCSTLGVIPGSLVPDPSKSGFNLPLGILRSRIDFPADLTPR